MKSKSVVRTALASVALGALFGSTQLMANCDSVSVMGKILNSSHDPALGSIYDPIDNKYIGGVGTVGVVALNGGNKFGKLKCALVGVEGDSGEPPLSPQLPVLPDFTHTISCDDSVDVFNDQIFLGIEHSQLTFDTSGYFTGGDGFCTLFFTEHSVPRGDGSGKGIFAGTTGGSLTIEGTLNYCTNSVDMKFTGDICVE
jgi:hypothetical protein